MSTKPVWTSKTFWFNLVAMIAAVMQIWGVAFPLSNEDLLVVVAFANIILRFVTKQPVTVS